MSQQMTITRVMEGDEWGNDYGRNQSYTLDLELADGSVVQDIVSNRKIKDDGTHKEPQEQEVVWGDLLPMGKNQRKLKLDYDAMKEHGSSPRPSGGSTESKTSNSPKQETDWEVRNAEIRRQHSQEMALRFMEIGGNVPGRVGVDLIADLADWFDQDAIAAGQKASGQRSAQGAAPNDSPRLDSLAAAPDQVPADLDFSGARTEEPKPSLNYPKSDLPDVDRDHVMLLLSSAGMTFAGAQEKVADYILTQLSVSGREKAALSGLQDQNLDRQSSVLAQLKAETEKWLGSPLPQGDALDGSENVPF